MIEPISTVEIGPETSLAAGRPLYSVADFFVATPTLKRGLLMVVCIDEIRKGHRQ
jgi:hypothetical protein